MARLGNLSVAYWLGRGKQIETDGAGATGAECSTISSKRQTLVEDRSFAKGGIPHIYAKIKLGMTTASDCRSSFPARTVRSEGVLLDFRLTRREIDKFGISDTCLCNCTRIWRLFIHLCIEYFGSKLNLKDNSTASSITMCMNPARLQQIPHR